MSSFTSVGRLVTDRQVSTMEQNSRSAQHPHLTRKVVWLARPPSTTDLQRAHASHSQVHLPALLSHKAQAEASAPG